MYKTTGWRGESKAATMEDVITAERHSEARGYDGRLESLEAEVRALARMLAATLDVMTQDQRDRFAAAYGWELDA